MARIVFGSHLREHLGSLPSHVSGATVGEVLDAAFLINPTARSYVLDDQGAIRKHVAVFMNGEPIVDRQRLSDPVADRAEVFVTQALSGG